VSSLSAMIGSLDEDLDVARTFIAGSPVVP